MLLFWVSIQDHPRMGGEKRIYDTFSNLLLGSPPHGRGKGSPARSSAPPRGITPAWAGKSLFYYQPIDDAGDHPRVGGEKDYTVYRTPDTPGSPPRRRGKAFTKSFEEHGFRITPA